MIKSRKLLCAVLVCALVGVAYAGATKIRSFTTYGEPEGADGMAILNTADSQKLVVQLILTDFTPNTAYVPALFDGVNEYMAFGAFWTDDHGHANWHGDVSTLYPWSNLRIYHCVGDVNPVCELRAQGNP